MISRRGSRDDMVIRVRLPDAKTGAAPSHAADEERQPFARRTRKAPSRTLRILKKLAKSRLAQRMGMSAARRLGGGARMLATPAGAAVAAAAVAAGIAVRLGTGRSFENMGANLEFALLGNTAADAMAKQQARAMLEADPMASAYVGNFGVTPSIMKVFEMQAEMNRQRNRGAGMFMRDERFQVNNWADMVALTVGKEAVRRWNEAGGPDLLTTIAKAAGGQATKDDFKIKAALR